MSKENKEGAPAPKLADPDCSWIQASELKTDSRFPAPIFRSGGWLETCCLRRYGEDLSVVHSIPLKLVPVIEAGLDVDFELKEYKSVAKPVLLNLIKGLCKKNPQERLTAAIAAETLQQVLKALEPRYRGPEEVWTAEKVQQVLNPKPPAPSALATSSFLTTSASASSPGLGQSSSALQSSK